MNYELSLRLQACLDALTPLQYVGDIGTDHAYLPCIGILNKQITRAIAADIGEGPLQAAKATVNRYHLNDHIELRLGSGLSVLKPGEVEGVVIAGMGGKLINSILEADILLARSFKRLILQPNIDANLVRAWLADQQFIIISENIILEDDKFYEIIVAEPASDFIKYSLLDIEYGPILRQNPESEVFKAKWKKNLIKTRQILESLPESHPRIKPLKEREQQIKEVLKI